MTKAQIVKKMIKKAVKGGYDKQEAEDFLHVLKQFKNNPCTQMCLIITFIFSHKFAKTYWGEECYYQGEEQLFDDRYKWQYHLQTMVLEEEPLKYIEKFLDKEVK